MKYPLLLIAIFCCFGLLSFDAPRGAKQKQFIEQVYTDLVPANYRYYYLEDTGYAVNIDLFFEDKHTMKYLVRQYPEFAGMSSVDFIKEDSLMVWHTIMPQKARVIPNTAMADTVSKARVIGFIDRKFYEQHKDSILRTRPYNEMHVPVNPPYSRRFKKRLLDQYADSLEAAIPPERTNYYRFGKPVFSKDDRYAIVELGNRDSVSICIYHKVQDRWKLLIKTFTEY